MKALFAALLLSVSVTATTAEPEVKRFLVDNGRAVVIISADGGVIVEGEPTAEVVALVAMLRQATKHVCRVSST